MQQKEKSKRKEIKRSLIQYGSESEISSVVSEAENENDTDDKDKNKLSNIKQNIQSFSELVKDEYSKILTNLLPRFESFTIQISDIFPNTEKTSPPPIFLKDTVEKSR